MSLKWALTRGAQVTAQFVMYRKKNCPAKSRTPLRVNEVEPLLCEEEDEEEVELSALQDADRTLGRRDGPPSGDGTAQSGQTEVFLKRQEAEMWHQQEVRDGILLTGQLVDCSRWFVTSEPVTWLYTPLLPLFLNLAVIQLYMWLDQPSQLHAVTPDTWSLCVYLYYQPTLISCKNILNRNCQCLQWS